MTDPDELVQQLLHATLPSPLSPLERQQLYSFAFEQAPVGKSIRLPKDGTYAVNRALGEMLGYEPEEYSRINLFDLCPPDQQPGLKASLEQLAAGSIERFSYEQRLQHRLGHSLWLLVQVLAVRDAQGAFRGTFAEVQDISARKRQELELAEANQRQAVSEALARLGCWEVDAHTFRYYRTRVALELIGYEDEPNEVPFEQAIAKFHPEERERVANIEREAIAQNKPFGPIDTRILRSNGEVMHVRLEARIVHDEFGKPAKLLGYFLDITESLRQERQLRKACERLEAQNEQIRELARLVSQSLRGPLAELQAKARELAEEGPEPGTEIPEPGTELPAPESGQVT